MTERVLRVPFRQQNTGYYCGPATIEMILLYRKISKTQHDLWDDVQATHLQMGRGVAVAELFVGEHVPLLGDESGG